MNYTAEDFDQDDYPREPRRNPDLLGQEMAEKILAAKRANIKEIILSIENKKDIEEIKKVYLRGIKFIYVKNMFEVIDYSITNRKVPNSKFFKL